jgi:uncharacterized protein (DUF3820 family)
MNTPTAKEIETVKVLWDLIEQELAGADAQVLLTLLGRRLHARPEMAAEGAKESPQRPATAPMTDPEARAFGQQVLSWGKHAGRTIDEVPLDYLVWLAGQEDEFRRELRRYLASPRIDAELRMTG